MDRNNPVWREYLKAVIRIQIDAGVDGIQLDEAELPIGAFQYGGCFCKDCMKGFRAYLQARRPSAARRSSTASTSTRSTTATGCSSAGYDFKDDRETTPLFGDYYRFQCRAIKRHFARAGRLRPRVRPASRAATSSCPATSSTSTRTTSRSADDVDLLITEMRNTTYRQPEWYRYVAGVRRGDKDVVVVENPYGGVVPELLDRAAGRQGLRPVPAVAVRGRRAWAPT